MRILIIRTDRIGDMILTLPMAAAIKQARPTDHVIMLARAYTKPLVSLCPDVDEIFLYDEGESLSTLVKQLRSINADAVLIPSPKFRLVFAAYLAKIPIRIGTAYRWYSLLLNRKIREHRKTAERNEAEYNLRMLSEIAINANNDILPTLEKSKLPINSLTGSYIVFHCGTGGSTDAWSADHWVELAKKLFEQYHYTIVLTGTANEGEFLFILAERMKHYGIDVHILSQGDLLQLAAVLSQAKLVVSAGTGPGHLASALGAPTVGIFPLRTPISKERWGFRGLNAVSLSPLIPPRPTCPDCDKCDCTQALSAEQVLEAANNLLRFERS